jgi:uncharacterized protein
MTAVKMVATTSMMSIVFSYGFLLTGTLWTAVGQHVAMNVTLHTITGMDGAGSDPLWKPIFGRRPTGYDAGFWTLIAVTGLIAFLSLSQYKPKDFRELPKLLDPFE